MRSKLGIMVGVIALGALLTLVAASCVAPTPQVVVQTQVVEKVETQVVKEVQTQVVEKVVTQEVEKTIVVTPVPDQGRVFRVGMFSSPQSFNPLVTTDDYSATVFEQLYGQLVRYDYEGAPIPWLAESWEVSEDATEYTIRLRNDVTWSDGTPFTAKDVEMTIRLHGTKAVGSIFAGSFAGIKGMSAFTEGTADKIEGLQVIDDQTIKFVLEAPNVAFLRSLDYFILPAHVLGDVPPDQLANNAFFKAPTVSVGPYKFVQYQPDQFIEFEANDKYWKGEPQIKRLIYRIGSQDVLLAQLQKDELDFAMIPAAEVQRIKGLYDTTVTTIPGVGSQLMHVNMAKPYLQDKRVRQAIAYALPRKDMVQALYFGAGTVQNSPNRAGWVVPPDLNAYDYDVEKAKQLMAEANWDPANKLVMRYSTGNKAREMSAPLIQQALKAIGMEVELQVTDFSTLLNDLKAGEYDLALLGWTGPGDPDLDSIVYESKNMPPAGWNLQAYKNDKVDQLFEQGRQALDQAERQKAYYELYRILNDELPTVFLWSEDLIYGYNNRLQNFKPNQYETWAYLANVAFPNIEQLTLAGE